eukprot:12885254-Prorocentrum_lima.AAC.1
MVYMCLRFCGVCTDLMYCLMHSPQFEQQVYPSFSCWAALFKVLVNLINLHNQLLDPFQQPAPLSPGVAHQ